MVVISHRTRADLIPPNSHSDNNKTITLWRQLGSYWHITQLEY